MQATLLVFPKRYVWTRKKYEEAIGLGVFSSEDRVELLAGVIVEKMPQNSPLSTTLTLTEDALRPLFTTGYIVRGQMSLVLDDQSEPEPDIAVIRGTARDYKDAQPAAETAVLVVEVSDSTLATDRGLKAALYARARVPECWIVNVEARVLEVHRQPGPTEDPARGVAYQEITPDGSRNGRPARDERRKHRRRRPSALISDRQRRVPVGARRLPFGCPSRLCEAAPPRRG